MAPRIDSAGAGGQPDLEALAGRYSNRGRFGPASEPPCALAFVTPARLRGACALVRRGAAVACGLPAAADPREFVTRVRTPRPLRDGFAGRGVLLDVARTERRHLKAGEAIGPELLDACAEAEGVAVETGDLVLVRTGALAGARRSGRWEPQRSGPAPGLGLACAGWLYRREVALAATDGPAVEALESGDAPLALLGIAHRETGVLFGTHFDLERLALACAEDGNYAFLLVVGPLPSSGALPAQPVALR